MSDLVLAQAGRFASLDPLLPVVTEPPQGETLVATLADGSRVTGVLRVTITAPDAPDALWSALETWELTPLIGTTGTVGMDAVLRALRARLDRESPGDDSACLVAWPSRDAEATRALLDHGLQPLSALAVRTGTGAWDEKGAEAVRVRPARPEDADDILRLELAEIEYSAQVGNLRMRPETATCRRARLMETLSGDRPPWLAELGDEREPAGVVGTGLADVVERTWLGTVLPAGRWGYVGALAVRPSARGRGVGRGLMAVAHAALGREGVRGTYLYYNPANPLSPVFWHRQGYRPLWTIWETRPATMLR